jgi:hypothetical protein
VTTALVIAACGSSSGSSSSSSAAAGSSTSAAAGAGRGRFGNPAQRAKLIACLKQHGVTLPSRPPGGGPPAGSGSGAPPSGSGSANGAPPAGGAGGGGRGFFGGGGPGANPKVRTALQACGANFGGRANPAARKAQVTKFVTCVSQHGYQLPKPNLSGNGAVFPSKIQSDPAFQKASRACASLLRPPGAGGGPGGGAPGTGTPPSNA